MIKNSGVTGRKNSGKSNTATETIIELIFVSKDIYNCRPSVEILVVNVKKDLVELVYNQLI